MDPRLAALLARQHATRFSGLSGSDVRSVLRLNAALLDEIITTSLPPGSAVRELKVMPRAGNRFDVSVKLARPALMPAINVTVAVERQPELPANPTLVLHLSGGGAMLRFAGMAASSFGGLPPGVTLQDDRVTIDIRAAARAQGQAELLDYVQDVAIASEEGVLILLVHAHAP